MAISPKMLAVLKKVDAARAALVAQRSRSTVTKARLGQQHTRTGQAVNRALAGLYRSKNIVPLYEKWFGSMTTAGPLIAAMYLMNGLPE